MIKIKKSKNFSIAIVACCIMASLAFTSCSPKETNILMFVGSYTGGIVDTGIYVYKFDPHSGTVDHLYSQENTINPSFLCLSSDGSILYACTESQLPTNGTVSMFAIDHETGELSFKNKVSAGGRNPVHLALNNKENLLIDCNYTDASIALFDVDKKDSLPPYSQLLTFGEGSKVIQEKQDLAHIHSSNFSPDGDFLFVQDLGTDKIRTYEVKNKANEKPLLRQVYDIDLKPGTGPRHFTFHPNGQWAYGISEFSGMINLFYYEDKKLNYIAEMQSNKSNLDVYQSADIHISNDGKFLYASNRKPEENTISIFKINQRDGKLELLDHISTGGDHPRNFAIDPTDNYLIVANQFSNNVVVFKRDQKTGLLKQTSTEITLPNPSSIVMKAY